MKKVKTVNYKFCEVFITKNKKAIAKRRASPARSLVMFDLCK